MCCWISIFIALVLLYLLNIYMNGGVCKLKKDLTGIVIFITGANTGIGKETALELARMGATIIIGCRDTTKGQQVVDQIKQLNKAPVHLLKLDLSDLTQIRSCADAFKSLKIPKIDILINNAGVMATQTYLVSKQSLELQFATNHVGHFLLTELLMPYLKAASKSRVVIVSSLAHNFANIDFQDINCKKWADSKLWGTKYSSVAYGNSKLSNILHAMEIQNHHGVKACSLHPGYVRTELIRHVKQNIIFGAINTILSPLLYILSKSALQGAQTTLECALMDYDKLVDGGYYSDCKLKTPKKATPALANKMWEKTVEIIKQYN